MKIPFKNRIIVDGTGKYCGRVEGLLNAIDRTKLGRALFTEIGSRSKGRTRLTISANPKSVRGTLAKYDDRWKASRAGLRFLGCSDAEAGRPIYYTGSGASLGLTLDARRSLTPAQVKAQGLRALVGTGTGASVTLPFSPGHFPKRLAGHTLTMRADEVLVHELVHGMRMMQGLVACTLNVPAGYDNDEEFWGITIANVYRSEKAHRGGKTGDLRGPSHSKFDQMLDHPETFYRDPTNMKMIERFFSDHRTFSTTIAKKVVAGFNPFAIALRSKPALEAGR